MLNNKRQQRIFDELNDKEIVNVADLSEQFHASTMTIRRDLKYLEDMGIARRVHGGAVLIKPDITLPPFTERFDKCQQEKDSIAKAAMKLIRPDSVICLDAGTTSMAITDHIPEDIQLTIISSGIKTTAALCRFRNLDIIQVGGLVHHSSFTVCGVSLASDFISKFNADIAFISTRAIRPDAGTFESAMSLVDEKQAFAAIAKKVVVLADYTKFEGTSLLKALPLKDIDVVITDNKAPSDSIRQLREAGIEVIIAVPE